MKNVIALLMLMALSYSGNSQNTKWTIDDSHAKMGFKITHFGISETEGRFKKFTGTVLADKADFSDANITITIDANSIDTDNTQRDTHLRSKDFFDIEKYPTIVFKSKALRSSGKNTYRLTGDFTMHGITKVVTFDVVYRGTVAQDPFGNTKAGFKISGSIDRTQWGLTWTGTLASGDLLVANEVLLDCNVELTKVK